MSKPLAFQALVTKGHDMEATIAIHREKSFGFTESKKDKAEFRRNANVSKNSTREQISISEANDLDYWNTQTGK